MDLTIEQVLMDDVYYALALVGISIAAFNIGLAVGWLWALTI